MVLVDELVRRGVRHAVLCPGSRSAPLAYALQDAERAGRLTLHVRVDERSAGFLALGLAKLTRVPAVVVTTSGTAVANLHPAVLEAHHGVVPLVVLSADRPVELRGTGANQTTSQPGMFGPAVRWECDLPAPSATTPQDADQEALRWVTAVADAVRAATGAADGPTSEPGPVHLNVQLREPLVPTPGPRWPGTLPAPSTATTSPTATSSTATGSTATGSTTTGPTTTGPTATGPATHAATRPPAGGVPLAAVPRTLVVVGDLPDPARFAEVVAWAASHGWPVVAEPFGSHPRPDVVPHGALLLGVPSWLDAHAPDRVVTVGRVTLSRPVAAILRRPGTTLEAVRMQRWIEPSPAVDAVHDPEVLDHHGAGPGDPQWSRAWSLAGERLAAAVERTVPQWGTAPAAVSTLLDALPSGATLFVGSSNSVRDLEVVPERAADLVVVASRGLAGIDGCVSTAVGLALGGAHPAYALMGDLTFLHDANGLLVGPHEPRPDLTVVVTNDDGGGIFTLLEPGEPERADDFERVFGTPTGVDLAALCAAHGVAHERVTSADALRAAVARPPLGLRVVEVPVDRGTHRGAHERLRGAAVEALQQP